MNTPQYDFWNSFESNGNNNLQPNVPLQGEVQRTYQAPEQSEASAPRPQNPQDTYNLTKPIGILRQRELAIQAVDKAFERPLHSVVPQVLSDKGNCTPRYIRSSMYKIPMSKQILKSSGLPFVLSLQPFAAPHRGEVYIFFSFKVIIFFFVIIIKYSIIIIF